MSAEQFRAWVEAMQAAGRIRAGYGQKKDIAGLLGISLDRLAQFEAHGTAQKQTDLACAALLAGLAPFSARV